MRYLIYILFLLPVVAFAQDNPSMPPNMPMDMEKMQQMQRNMQQMDMGKMQEAMACMKGLDQSAFKGLEEEGKKWKRRLAPCAAVGIVMKLRTKPWRTPRK